jgi:glycosyltransferase involved in cell wall biosynthesis
MTRKKILWLCSWYPGKTEPFNGDFIQRHARAAALYNDVYVIHVAGDSTGTIQQTEKEIIKAEGLTEHLVYFKKSTSFFGRIMAHYRWLFLYKQAVRKYMVENGKPDMVHVHIPYKAGLLGLWLKAKYKLPYVLSEHWGIYNEVEVLNYAGRKNYFKSFTKKAFQQASVCHSVSSYLADGVNRLVVPKKFDIIHNVTDTNLFFPINKAKRLFRFIHVSNMVPLKNAEGIIKAFHQLLQQGVKAQLWMVGNQDNKLKVYADSIGLSGESILFYGEVPYSKVASLMQQADCLLVNSNIENSPCVIGEALCCGLPVIATRVGGIPELTDESNAILIQPGNDNELCNAMQLLINENSRFDSKKIAENAISKFSYAVIGKKFEEMYLSVIISKQ